MTLKTKPIRAPKERYIATQGGRKTASARVRFFKTGKGITVNGKDYKEYFVMPKHQAEAEAPLAIFGDGEARVSVVVRGSGIHAQAQAVRHGISIAIVKISEDFRKRFRAEGFMTRDSRMVERKKYGLKKARRSPQWQKR